MLRQFKLLQYLRLYERVHESYRNSLWMGVKIFDEYVHDVKKTKVLNISYNLIPITKVVSRITRVTISIVGKVW